MPLPLKASLCFIRCIVNCYFRYEALLFLLMYVIYIVLMYFNRSLEAWILPCFPTLSHDIRPTLRETKLHHVGTILSSEDLAANNVAVNELEANSDNGSTFSLCTF